MAKLLEKIKLDLLTGMKNKDKEKVSYLRLLIAELEKEKISLGKELTDSESETVVSRQLKKLSNETEVYKSLNKSTGKQEKEKELLLEYLPKQMNDEEIKQEVFKAIDLSLNGEISNPMKYLSAELKGRADMKNVSKILKEING